MKIKKIILVFVMLVTLAACTSNKNGAETSKAVKKEYATLKKMKEVMKKNDSFKVSLTEEYTLSDEVVLSINDLLYSFNNFYNPQEKQGKAHITDLFGNVENNAYVYLDKDQIIKRVNDTSTFIDKDEYDTSFVDCFEFLHVEKKYIDYIKQSKKDGEIVLNMKLKLDTLDKRSDYFYKDMELAFPNEVEKAELKITLNKDYTIKESEAHYVFKTDKGLFVNKSKVEFLEYGIQEIDIPNT